MRGFFFICFLFYYFDDLSRSIQLSIYDAHFYNAQVAK